MSKGTDWIIVVLDVYQTKWPSARQLVDVGAPLRLTERYRKERWHFTTGLKRMVKQPEAKN